MHNDTIVISQIQKIFWGGGTAPAPPPDSPSGQGTPSLHTPLLSAPSAPRCFDPPAQNPAGAHEPGKGPALKPYARAPCSVRPALKEVKYILARELNLGGKQFVHLV